MLQRSVFPTNTELVNSFVFCGLLTRRGTNTLPRAFVTMVVKSTFSQKKFYLMNVWTLRLTPLIWKVFQVMPFKEGVQVGS